MLMFPDLTKLDLTTKPDLQVIFFGPMENTLFKDINT